MTNKTFTNNTIRKNNKTRAGMAVAAIALMLAAIFAFGTVSVGAASVNQAQTAAVSSSSDTLAMQIAKRVYAGHRLQQADYSDQVILIDGMRVYMDLKHLPPANTGKPVHVNATGSTSYGFDWTCNCDNFNYVISCNYNFTTGKYDFVIFGKTPGDSNINVIYNINDNSRGTIPVHLHVDNNLNAKWVK